MKPPSRRNKNRPLYQPSQKLMYLKNKVGEQIVIVNYWDETANEYWCYSEIWSMDIHCQEKDLKPIEATQERS